MNVVTIHKAKTELSKLLKRVEAGEEIVIARGGKQIARLSPMALAPAKSRGYGAWKGNYTLPGSFFDPLPDEELDAWEGKYGLDP